MLYVGDKETNRYTDAVINDIKGRIKTDFEIAFYGGSTYTPSSHRGGFLRDVASTALGVYAGEKLTDRRRKKEASKEIQWRYTCSLSCPYKGKGYGSSRCTRDPRTCGHGSRY